MLFCLCVLPAVMQPEKVGQCH